MKLERQASDDWLDALTRFHERSAQTKATNRAMLDVLAVPSIFAAIRNDNGAVASVAVGTVHDGLACVSSVFTAVSARRQGLSQRVLGQIHRWAQQEEDATGSCLGVVAANAPALALYHGLGYRETDRYHYRRKPT